MKDRQIYLSLLKWNNWELQYQQDFYYEFVSPCGHRACIVWLDDDLIQIYGKGVKTTTTISLPGGTIFSRISDLLIHYITLK